MAWAERRGKLDAYNVGMHIKTSSVFGYLLVRSLAWLRPWRPMSYRYREEQQLIERWLALVADAARRDAALAREVAECARLIKGYGETHRRGKANFLAIVDALVENPPTADAREQAAAIRKAREAALADPEGQALGKTLGKPVVWLKPVKSLSGPMASVPKSSISAERQALYRRMDKHNLAPLWEVLHNLIPERAGDAVQAGAVEIQRCAALPDGGRQADHRQGGDPARADPREPRHARRVVHHAEPVRRAAAHPAGRDRAQPPPFAVGAALHRRGLRRLHRGRRRAHHDAAGRLHHHAVVDLARPRQPRQRAGGVDGRPRHPHRADLRRAVPRGVRGGSAAGVAQRRRVGRALRPGPGAARRDRAFRQDLADLQLSLRAQPRVARR